MIFYLKSKPAFKNTIYALLFLLFIAVHAPLQAASFNNKTGMAVIKDTIAEMNSGFPAPESPAICPDTEKCRRAHQGLFNELVECLEGNDVQIKIAFHTIAYGVDAGTKKPLNTFWMHRKQLVTLNDLQKQNSELLAAIPNAQYGQEPTIILTYPCEAFSLGTRFKHVPERDTDTAYGIIRADYATGTTTFDLIPHQNGMVEIKQNASSTRKLFVKIINDLVDRVTDSGPNNVIPYVWGGSSFVTPYEQSIFYSKDGTWHREGNTNPYSGYDCSEFIMRMAQIAGIDFPWKTSIAIEQGRRALNEEDHLENGDIIWVKGHVMAISNIGHNEIIESRGYGSGYGCVHRITLDKCFDGVATYKDLLTRYYNHETITFKNKQGTPEDTARHFKLLKLMD